jgi:hypothetical protein
MSQGGGPLDRREYAGLYKAVRALQPLPIGMLSGLYLSPLRNIPAGWLYCDGSLYDCKEYPELFNVIGYSYGGSGEQFAVPDLPTYDGVGCCVYIKAK